MYNIEYNFTSGRNTEFCCVACFWNRVNKWYSEIPKTPAIIVKYLPLTANFSDRCIYLQKTHAFCDFLP